MGNSVFRVPFLDSKSTCTVVRKYYNCNYNLFAKYSKSLKIEVEGGGCAFVANSVSSTLFGLYKYLHKSNKVLIATVIVCKVFKRLKF